MNVGGHDDVAEEEEVMALSEVFEGLFEDGAGAVVLQPRLLPVTGEVDGMVVAVLLIA